MAKRKWKGKRSKLPVREDLAGKKIGHLSVISKSDEFRSWKCLCVCNKVVHIPHNRLIDKNNPKTHCGCQKKSIAKTCFREYHCWWDTVARCTKTTHPSYANYGGKGLTIHESWIGNFPQFLKDMGACPKNHILGLKENQTVYGPGTAIWIIKPMKRKGEVKMIPHPKTGEMIKVSDLAKELGLSYQQLRAKLLKEEKWKSIESSTKT